MSTSRTIGTWKKLSISSVPRIFDDKYYINIVSSGLGVTCETFGKTKEETQANADFICNSVNNHEELVKTVEHCKLMFSNLLSGYEDQLQDSAKLQLQEKIEYLETLIKKAK